MTASQKGNLGSAVLAALVDTGFTVTIVGRTQKRLEDLPAGVTSIAVDYTSPESLVAAFQGQDVLVVTMSTAALALQKPIIDAAIAAGVKRFIRSEYGSVSTDPAVAHLGVYAPLVDIKEYLLEKADAGLIEYTIFSCGVFMESLFMSGRVFDWENKIIELWEGGKHPVSCTSLAGVGKVIAGSLEDKNAEATKNRNIFAHDYIVSQAQVLELAKKQAQPGTQWNVTDIEDALEELRKRKKIAQQQPGKGFVVVRATVFGGLFKAKYDEVDNDLFGLKMISEEEFEAKFSKAFKCYA